MTKRQDNGDCTFIKITNAQIYAKLESMEANMERTNRRSFRALILGGTALTLVLAMIVAIFTHTI